MSLETWKAEFYPVPAENVPEEEAVAHSLRKWRGLRQEALERHGVARREEHSYFLIDGDTSFCVDGDSCALCVRHVDGPCRTCPLAQARDGVRCDHMASGERRSPYHAWLDNNDPEPMIRALEGLA